MEDSPKSHDSHGSLLLTSQKTYEDTPTNQHTPNTYPTHTQHISQAPVVYCIYPKLGPPWTSLFNARRWWQHRRCHDGALPRRMSSGEYGHLTCGHPWQLGPGEHLKLFPEEECTIFFVLFCWGWKQNSTYKFIFYLLFKENQ